MILLVMLNVLLFTLFTEPAVGKAQAKSLEENLRNSRNCKYIYSLLAGAAAVAADTT